VKASRVAATLKTLNGLANRIQRLRTEKIPKEVERLKRGVVEVMLVSLVDNTIVDTSKALSNWQVNVGSALTNELDAYVPGARGSTQGVSGSIVVNIGIAKVKGPIFNLPIYISNNAPYIETLNNRNDGDFVERSIGLANIYINSFKFKL